MPQIHAAANEPHTSKTPRAYRGAGYILHRTGRMRPQHFSFSVSLFASHEESKAQVLQPPQAVHAAELRGRRQVVVLDFEDGRRQPIRR